MSGLESTLSLARQYLVSSRPSPLTGSTLKLIRSIYILMPSVDTFGVVSSSSLFFPLSQHSTPLQKQILTRSDIIALVWFSIHLPFIMSFVLSASALAILVRAHDCPDAPLDSLYEAFVPRSEEHITAGLRWFYCGGLGISLLCLSIITFTHTHRKIPNQRLRKETRLLFRITVAIVIICLPNAHLNSLQLVACTTVSFCPSCSSS